MHATNPDGNKFELSYVKVNNPDENLVAFVEMRPGFRFEVYRAHKIDAYIVLAPWNGSQTYITQQQLQDGMDAFTIALRAALQRGAYRSFIEPVVIDDTNLFMPRVIVDITANGG